MTVEDLISDKGSVVDSVAREATVYDAIEKMVHHNVGALVVVEQGFLVGIITERDYLRYVALRGRTSKTTTVGEIMSIGPTCVGMDATLSHCMQIMTEGRVRHLPVLIGGRLGGIVSLGDIVKRLISE